MQNLVANSASTTNLHVNATLQPLNASATADVVMAFPATSHSSHAAADIPISSNLPLLEPEIFSSNESEASSPSIPYDARTSPRMLFLQEHDYCG